MAIGVGFDTICVASHAAASKQSLRSERSTSSSVTHQNSSHTFQSSSGLFVSPSLLRLSLPGSRPSIVRSCKNYSSNSSRIGKLACTKKGRLLDRSSPFGGELNCTSNSCDSGRILGQRGGYTIKASSLTSRECENRPGCLPEKHLRNGSLSGASARRMCPGRGTLTVTRCEAEGGGNSYNDRIATVESDTGAVEDSDRYAGNGGQAGSQIPDRSSESDTSLITNGSSGEDLKNPGSSTVVNSRDESSGDIGEESALDVMKEILRVALEDLEKCRRSSEKFEEKAQTIAERAIALKDEAVEAERLTNASIAKVQNLLEDEAKLEEELQKTLSTKAIAGDLVKTAEESLIGALSRAKVVDHAKPDAQEAGGKEGLVEAKVEVITTRTVDISVVPAEGYAAGEPVVVPEKETTVAKTEVTVEASNAEEAVALASVVMEETEALESARSIFRETETLLERIEGEISRLQSERIETLQEVERLRAAADRARETALAADEDVASAMAEAEQAVALQLDAAQRVGDAEYALHKAESFAIDAAQEAAAFAAAEAGKLAQSFGKTIEEIEEELELRSIEAETEKPSEEEPGDGKLQTHESIASRAESVLEKGQDEDVKSALASSEVAGLAEKIVKEHDSDNKKLEHEKKVEPVKETPIPKASKKRSSRFYSASYFSSDDGEEFSPGKAYAEFASSAKPLLTKIIVGAALLFAGGAYVNNRLERPSLLAQPPAYTTSIDQVNVNTKPIVAEFKKLTKSLKDLVNKLPAQEVNEEEASLFDVLWLLLASVVFVPLFMKIPGGSPVLGYLVAGVLIGPHTVHIIQNVHGTKAIAEFGVVFLLFNIGLELSVERLSSMKKYVFGLGTTQVFATAAAAGIFLNFVSKISGPAAIIIASGLALSSTAVVLQVLQERGESTSRHGRATFSVLLFQDLAVVVLLILIPLLSAKGGVGLKEIGSALGVAGIKAVVAIVAIIASGRLFLRPIYKQMADNHNPEIFAANTLLVVLGTSVLTARAGLSMALGAFLAGLLLAETEFALQVESDIAPYRGLLLGLFFMTVGMSIDPKLFVARFPEIITALALLIVGKTALVACVGRLFGLSTIAAVRTGLLLAPGGEFAFVAFGEAVNQGILSPQLSSLLFLVVGLSMALTPWLAAGGQLIAARFEQQDVRSLLPQENETDDLQGHIIICGFGRVGQIIAQLLSERLIPFVALDVRSERVSVGRQLDLPVYFGDAGSKEVLHKVGAERAAAAVITLDTPGANYRTVWALSKHFPGVKTFVRAHDVDHGINLEKAGATAVVPETLEPSLQLAAAVLAQAKVPAYEIASAIDEFRSRHLSELTELSESSGTSLGYGFSRVMTKPLIESLKIKIDEDGVIEKRIEGNIVAVP